MPFSSLALHLATHIMFFATQRTGRQCTKNHFWNTPVQVLMACTQADNALLLEIEAVHDNFCLRASLPWVFSQLAIDQALSASGNLSSRCACTGARATHTHTHTQTNTHTHTYTNHIITMHNSANRSDGTLCILLPAHTEKHDPNTLRMQYIGLYRLRIVR